MDTKKKNIAVFASGSGTNFEAIVTACRNGTIAGSDVALLVCDHHDAFAVERAKRLGVKYFIFDRKAYDSKQEYETAVLEAYPKRILNIHPALLPSFKGATAIIDAFEYGVKVFGVTVHLIDNTVDGGVIISQRAFEYEGDSLEEVEHRIHGIEHVLYPEAINRVLSKYE